MKLQVNRPIKLDMKHHNAISRADILLVLTLIHQSGAAGPIPKPYASQARCTGEGLELVIHWTGNLLNYLSIVLVILWTNYLYPRIHWTNYLLNFCLDIGISTLVRHLLYHATKDTLSSRCKKIEKKLVLKLVLFFSLLSSIMSVLFKLYIHFQVFFC